MNYSKWVFIYTKVLEYRSGEKNDVAKWYNRFCYAQQNAANKLFCTK